MKNQFTNLLLIWVSNGIGFGIIDDEVVQEASKQEVIRRYFKAACDLKKGNIDEETFERTKLILDELQVKRY